MRLLFEFLSRLPLAVLHGLGTLFGVLALLRPRHAALLRENLRLAGLSGRVSLTAVAAGLGQGVLELAAVWLSPLPRVLGWIREVEGEEHIAAAHAAGKGLILLVPHQACWEAAGIWYGGRFPTTALYRPPKQGWAHELMKRGRERGLVQTVPPDRTGVRALLAALKKGQAAFILPDQVANSGEGVWTTFFGRPVYFPSLPYRLAASTGAAVLLMVCERLPWGHGYRVHIERLDPLPAGLEEAVGKVRERVEWHIRRRPEHYLWSYRIFRHHAGAPPPPDLAAGD